jgi:type VI secretion system protein ImpC
VSTEDDDGGIVLGGISFGVGAHPAEAVPGDDNPSQGPAPDAAAMPPELGDVLLPLRVAVIANLMPSSEFNAGSHAPEHPVRVRHAEIDGLFETLKPRIAIKVESVVAEGARVRVDIPLNSMKSFRPDQLALDVPLLKALLDGRKALEQLRDGSLDIDGARNRLRSLWPDSSLVDRALGGVAVHRPKTAPAAAPPQASTESAVDNILSLVDVGDGNDDGQAPTAAATTLSSGEDGNGRFDAFISAVANSGKSSSAQANPDQAIALVEKAFGHQLGAILQHPEMRRLEQAWRGLELLVSRTPKTGVLLEVSCSDDAGAGEALQKALDFNASTSPPVSFALVDTVVDGTHAALARLRRLGEIGEANATPVLMNANGALFGHDSLDDVDRLDNKQNLFDAPARVPWRSEAHRPAMLWTSLALNRIVGRNGYDRRSSRIRVASVEEQPAGRQAVVWIQPAWAVATLAMRSFAKYEWPCGITGPRDGGLIESLPVRDMNLRGGETIATPLEAFFSTETQRALARLGLLALAAQPNSDDAYLMTAATAYVPPPKKTYDAGNPEAEIRLPQASLSDQLFVARVAQFLGSIGSKIGGQERDEDIRKFLAAALDELFRNAPPSGPEIQVAVSRADGRAQVAVTVRPRRFLGVGLEEITLGVPLA